MMTAHARPGTIVRVDLADGFRPPEMIKRRSAIVLSPPLPSRPLLRSIVPRGTTPPKVALAHHRLLRLEPQLPAPYDAPETWAKGDIVLTVALLRLRHLYARHDRSERVYDLRVFDPATFKRVPASVGAGLGL